jgi:hypothetical protein
MPSYHGGGLAPWACGCFLVAASAESSAIRKLSGFHDGIRPLKSALHQRSRIAAGIPETLLHRRFSVPINVCLGH